MFVEQLRAAVAASPRCELPKISALLWRAFAAGQIAEDDAQALAEHIELRKAIDAHPTLGSIGQGVARRVGSRPRTPASLKRRRRWTASGWLPPQIAARFTLG